MYPLSSATQFKVKVLDAGVTLVGDNSFGCVLDGFLKLERRVQRGVFERPSPYSPIIDVVIRLNEGQIRISVGSVKYDGVLPPVWCLQLCL